VAEEPTAEEPTAEEPTAEEPTAEEPTREATPEPTPAVAEEPAAEARAAAVPPFASGPDEQDVSPASATLTSAPSSQPVSRPVSAPLPPVAPDTPASWSIAWPALPQQEPEPRRRWWPLAVAAVVLVLVGGGVAFAVSRGGNPQHQARAEAAPASPAASLATPSATAAPSATATPSATASPAVAVTSPAPPKPRRAVGPLRRSDAPCTGTVGDYRKWQYPLTGFKPGATLHPQLAIRSDRGNGQTAGKPVRVSARGTATGSFCVPAGTHGTVTITVAGTTAERQIG
jgi:hypothetical protein